MGRSSNFLHSALFLLASFCAACIPALAFANPIDIGSAAQSFNENSAKPFFDLIEALCYVAGVVMVFRGIIMLKDNNEDPQRHPLRRAFLALVIAGMLLSFPSFAEMSGMSLFTGGDKADVADNFGLSASCGSGGSAGSSGGASGGPNIANAFAIFGCQNVPKLMVLATVISKLMGFVLMLNFLFRLMKVESGKMEMSSAIWTGVAGAMLWSFSSVVDMAFGSIGGSAASWNIGGGGGNALMDNMLAKSSAAAGSNPAKEAIQGVLIFVQLIGMVAFIRGTLLLKAMGDNKDGAFGRAMTHILGGALAMNIQWTMSVLAASFGLTETFKSLGLGVT